MESAGGSRATVLVVDDHPLIREGLTALLETEAWVRWVVVAADEREAAELAVTERVDVAVVDLRLRNGEGRRDGRSGEGLQGVQLIGRLRRAVPGCAVLVLTTTPDDGVVRACLAAGASAYVLKSSPPATIVRAVLTVADGGLVLGPRVTRAAVASPDREGLPAPLDRLSPGDLRLLKLVAEGCSNAQIAREVGISEKTVRNRLSGVLSTLGARDRVQAARSSPVTTGCWPDRPTELLAPRPL